MVHEGDARKPTNDGQPIPTPVADGNALYRQGQNPKPNGQAHRLRRQRRAAGKHVRFSYSTYTAACTVLLTLSPPALAQSTAPSVGSPTVHPTPADEATPLPGEPTYKLNLYPTFSADSINQRLEDANSRPAGIFPYGPVSLIDPVINQLNAALDKVGLKVGIAYTAVFQAASNGPGTRTAAGGDVDIFGDWRLLGGKDDSNKGFLYFYAENRHDLGTGIAPNALGGQIGSLWSTTNGFSEQPLTMKELYWEQRFAIDRVFFRVGKLDPENYYDSNYWQSDSKYFMNQAFSSFPVRSFPGQGLGVNLTTKLTDLFTISTGAQDAQGKKTRTGFDTIQDFNLFSAFELRLTPDIPGLGKGTYRFTGWYRDAGDTNGKPHDAGYAMSFDQHVTENLVPFFRYGFGEGTINSIDQMISAGIGWEGKLLTDSDVLAIAGSWGQPSKVPQRDQYVTEIFYRLQVSPDNQATIGYQVIFNPANSVTSDLVGILELRWRITF